MARLALTLLGSFQVTWDGEPVTAFATDKTRALLAYLVMERARPNRREHLVALLWPDQPEERARQSLRQALLYLRQALRPADEVDPVLRLERGDVQFNPALDVWIDAAEFDALAESCAHHRHRSPGLCLPCLRRLQSMIRLYRGEFLQGFSPGSSDLFEEWALLKREWLHCRATDALALLADFHERRAESERAREYARQLIRLEPWREETHRQLIRLYARDGQRSAALAQYQACRRVLSRDFGAEPAEETIALYERVKAGGRPAGFGPPGPSPLPPAATPFVDREREQAGLEELLAGPDCRLVTLLGPGGIGKTRLALQVAGSHQGAFPHGVAWVSLAALRSAEEIPPAIAHAVGLSLYGKESPRVQLFNYLRGRELLLVLDGVEHLPELPGLVDALLHAAPGVVALVTSRQRLSLAQERVYPIEGLPAPTSVDELTARPAAAAALFLQSARQVQHGFTPTEADLPALVEICRLVEGMPLAIEMAAAWTPFRTCAQIVAELASGLDLLATRLRNVPESQRSVRATFEQSWLRLSEEERRLFARLAVFQGGFEREAAEAVTGATPAGLEALVARSLIRHDPTGRYHCHELLRQFAAEKLELYPGEGPQAAARLAETFTRFLHGQEAALKGAGQEAALQAIDREIANVRLAWNWAVEAVGSPEAAAMLERSLESLYLYYFLRSWYPEGTAAFRRAVAAVEAAAAPAAPPAGRLLGELLARQARCSEFTGQPDETIALYRRSLEIFIALGERRAAALPMYGLGYLAYLTGAYDEARSWFDQSLERYREAGDAWGMATALSSQCLTGRRQGDYPFARQAGLESLALRRQIGDLRGIASSQNNLGLLYSAQGEYAAAQQALSESIEICQKLGHLVGTANALTGMVHVALRTGDSPAAVRYQRQAREVYREIGDHWGVAIAGNNLGQIVLEGGDAATARHYFEESAAIFRQIGVRTGLANVLNNLGQALFVAGEVAPAARTLREALEIAWAEGDLPITLEILTRSAVLWASQSPSARPLVVMAFALRHPALLEETRVAAGQSYAGLRNGRSPGQLAAAESEAAGADFAALVAELSQALLGCAAGQPGASPG